MRIAFQAFLFILLSSKGFSSQVVIENNPSYPTAEPPQLPLEVYSEEFAKILGMRPHLVDLAEGFGFTEGPVYLQIKNSEQGYLLFTDQINDNIMILRWHGLLPYDQITPLSWSKPVVFRHPSSIADGMRLDVHGNIYVGALDGVQVFNPEGTLIGKILMPKETANLTFGGKDNNILFICSSNSVWVIKLNTKGAKNVPEIMGQ